VSRTPWNVAVRGSIDTPAAGSSVPGALVRVTGWVLHEAGLLDHARIVVDDGAGSPVRLGVWRPDVVAAYPQVAHAATSGFEGTVDLRGAGGVARIALIVRRGDEPWTEAVSTEVVTAPPARVRDGARRRAAFTIVHNEPRWLGLWLAHYARVFDAGDLFVLDHGSTDGSTDAPDIGCHVVPVHREAAFDHHWLKTVVEDFQSFLLRSYDLVLFAEVDEFIVADPLRHAGLEAYLDALDRPAARCLGFNVVHQPDEPPLAFDRPLLAQRRYWHASLQYSKRLIARMPLRWSDGFHHEFNAPDDAPDPALLLVHMHRADYDSCLARHTASAARDWSEADLASGAGAQNRITEREAFDEWFRQGPGLDAPRELIPDHIRTLL
jgi:hypothetical protein